MARHGDTHLQSQLHGKLRQKDTNFEACLRNLARSCLEINFFLKGLYNYEAYYECRESELLILGNFFFGPDTR